MKALIGCMALVVVLFVVGVLRLNDTEAQLVFGLPVQHHVTLYEPTETVGFEFLVHEDLSRYLDEAVIDRLWLENDHRHVPLMLSAIDEHVSQDIPSFVHASVQVVFQSWLDDSVLSVQDATLHITFVDEVTLSVPVGDVHVFKNMVSTPVLDYERIDNIPVMNAGIATASGVLIKVRGLSDVPLMIKRVRLHPVDDHIATTTCVGSFDFEQFKPVEAYQTNKAHALPVALNRDDTVQLLVDFNLSSADKPLHGYALFIETNQGLYVVPSFTFINTDLFVKDHQAWFEEGVFDD